MSCRAVRWAKSACRSAIWAICAPCFDEIPLEQMNTSMTINATAPWLLSLYIAVAEEQGADISKLQGTVQNDLIKEYLSRGTYICPPKPSLKMIADVAEYCYRHVPKWNPMNVCFLPSAGSRCDTRAGTGLCAGHSAGGSGRAAAACGAGGFPGDGGPYFLLCERRHPVCDRDVQKCAPLSICGTRSARNAMASATRNSAASAMGCR